MNHLVPRLPTRDQVSIILHPYSSSTGTTAQTLNNLASLYDNQGKYGDAKLMYERALAIREEVLGPKHPDTAASLNNLALLYDNQGKYDDAELAVRASTCDM